LRPSGKKGREAEQTLEKKKVGALWKRKNKPSLGEMQKRGKKKSPHQAGGRKKKERAEKVRTHRAETSRGRGKGKKNLSHMEKKRVRGFFARGKRGGKKARPMPVWEKFIERGRGKEKKKKSSLAAFFGPRKRLNNTQTEEEIDSYGGKKKRKNQKEKIPTPASCTAREQQ